MTCLHFFARSVSGASLAALILWIGMAAPPELRAEEWAPRRMLVGPYGLPDEEFLTFAERVRPEFVIVGTFGPPQWAAQKDLVEWLAQWRRTCERLHRSSVKVIGMMELLNVGDTPEQYEAFRAFYEDRWPEGLLGKRPTRTLAELVELRREPLLEQTGWRAPRGCATNPHWRALQKALLKPLVDAGVDGFITHRNIYGTCGCPFCDAGLKPEGGEARESDPSGIDAACPHCRRGFRKWLAKNFDAAALKEQFGITDLATHQFPAVTGNYREHDRSPAPLELEMLRFSRHVVKDAIDDIFVQHGRTLKRDLIVAQWNHMPYFDELHLDRSHIPPSDRTTFAHAAADERWGLPVELWGRSESFFWYCNWGTTQNSQLEKQFAGDVTLYAKLLRSLARGRPYVINKYDFYRPRNMLAEAAATGMLAGAIEVPYRTEEDRNVMERYFRFLARHAELYARSNGESVADVLLVVPRSAMHEGRASGLELVERAGRTMIVEHVAFDVVPDDLLSHVDLDRYRAVVLAEIPEHTRDRLRGFRRSGGEILTVGNEEGPLANTRGIPAVRNVRIPASGGVKGVAPFRADLIAALGDRRILVEAPWTVQSHMYRQKGRLVVHVVNYDHDERAAGQSAVAREAPRQAPSVGVTIPLGAKERVVNARFLDPDGETSVELKYTQEGSRLMARTPPFLVYGVMVFELEE